MDSEWVLHEDPMGWSMWMPDDWTVDSDGEGSVIISVPALAVVGVLAADDTEESSGSKDYLLRNVAESEAVGLIDEIDFSPGWIVLDLDQDGTDGPYDMWGLPVGYTGGSPGRAYAYFNPETPSNLGYYFDVIVQAADAAALQELAETVLLTFEPDGGY